MSEPTPQNALYGHIWAGREKVSDTAFHVSRAREGVAASMLYVGGNGREI